MKSTTIELTKEEARVIYLALRHYEISKIGTPSPLEQEWAKIAGKLTDYDGKVYKAWKETQKEEKMNKEQKDVTSRYLRMIDAFSCDFESALEKGYTYNLATLDALIAAKDVDLIEDIHKLRELAFNLRHGKCKIIEI